MFLPCPIVPFSQTVTGKGGGMKSRECGCGAVIPKPTAGISAPVLSLNDVGAMVVVILLFPDARLLKVFRNGSIQSGNRFPVLYDCDMRNPPRYIQRDGVLICIRQNTAGTPTLTEGYHVTESSFAPADKSIYMRRRQRVSTWELSAVLEPPLQPYDGFGWRGNSRGLSR